MKKIISIMLILILLLSMIMVFNKSNATNLNQADLYGKGQHTDLLKYNNMNILTTYVVYEKDGIEYPVYCLQKDLEGVGEQRTIYSKYKWINYRCNDMESYNKWISI